MIFNVTRAEDLHHEAERSERQAHDTEIGPPGGASRSPSIGISDLRRAGGWDVHPAGTGAGRRPGVIGPGATTSFRYSPGSAVFAGSADRRSVHPARMGAGASLGAGDPRFLRRTSDGSSTPSGGFPAEQRRRLRAEPGCGKIFSRVGPGAFGETPGGRTSRGSRQTRRRTDLCRGYPPSCPILPRGRAPPPNIRLRRRSDRMPRVPPSPSPPQPYSACDGRPPLPPSLFRPARLVPSSASA